jgi:hypothetical protein
MNISTETTKNLTPKEQKRVEKLTGLILKLESGQYVSNRNLQRWLTVEEHDYLLVQYENQKTIVAEIKNKPKEIQEYTKRLGRINYLGTREFNSSGSTSINFSNRRDTEIEKLWEFLHYIISKNQNLQMWFDRHLNFNFETNNDVSLPQIITSRSLDNMSGGLVSMRRSKKEIQLGIFKTALDDLLYEKSDESNDIFESKSKSKKIDTSEFKF